MKKYNLRGIFSSLKNKRHIVCSCIVALSLNPAAAQRYVFHEGLIADITPQGWLKENLTRQKNGLSGHPEALSYPYKQSCE